MCPIDEPPAEVVALILDMSDRLNEVQLLSVRNHLQRLLYAELPRFAYVETYAVQDRAGVVAEPVIGLCNPGKGNDLNRIYQNPELARKRWEQDFADRAVGEARCAARQRRTARRHRSTKPFRPSPCGRSASPSYDGVPKRLIVVSDLLAERAGQRQRREATTAACRISTSFAASAVLFRGARRSQCGVRVHLYYMNRSDHRTQGAEHIRFWEDYFGAQGATVMTVERIFGD